MGWKAVREYYEIKHIVQITDEGICIGSGYVHNIIVIGLDGTVKKKYDRSWNDDLARYQAAFDADPEMLKEQVVKPDSFTKHIRVFTYDHGRILEKYCEEVGWPNVTHDGYIMYENTFSVDKSEVIAMAKKDVNSRIEVATESVLYSEKVLSEAKGRLEKRQAERDGLYAEYPDQDHI